MRTFIVFAMIFLLFGNLFTIAAEYKHKNEEPTEKEKETFNLLKNKFPGTGLDKNLNILRELAESREYINFLSEKYPTLDIQTFEDVANKVLPPKERYFKFFNEQFFYQTVEEIQHDELALIHKIATDYWLVEAIDRSQGDPPDKKRPSFRKLLSGPAGKKWLEQQNIIEKETELQPADWLSILRIFMHLTGLVSENQDADFIWIKTLFEKYGESDGILWVAVQTPVLLDRILYSFKTRESFLKRLHNPVHKRVHNRFIPR